MTHPDGSVAAARPSFPRRLGEALLREANAYIQAFLAAMPGSSGNRARVGYYRPRFRSLGKRPSFDTGMRILGPNNISIGDNFRAGRGCSLIADGEGRLVIGNNVALNAGVELNASIRGEIVIGNDVLIGMNTMFRSSDHVFDSPAILIRLQGHRAGRIVVDDDVWLGAGAILVGGITIGRGAVIAAGAVVTRDVAPCTVAGGVPARFIKDRAAAYAKSENR